MLFQIIQLFFKTRVVRIGMDRKSAQPIAEKNIFSLQIRLFPFLFPLVNILKIGGGLCTEREGSEKKAGHTKSNPSERHIFSRNGKEVEGKKTGYQVGLIT